MSRKKSSMNNETLSSALRYAEDFGWKIFPVYGLTYSVENKKYVCNCKKKHDEKTSGKHPAVSWRGYKGPFPTKEGNLISKVFSSPYKYNIGLPTGKENNLIIIDIDPRNGGSLEALLDAFSYLKESPRVRTGGGGYHIYLKYPQVPVQTFKATLPGFDIKSDGGYIILPPSLHIHGRYQWEIPPDTGKWYLWNKEIENFLKTVGARRAVSVQVPEKIPLGKRNNTLTSLAGFMRRKGFSADAIFAALKVENSKRCDPPLEEEELRTISKSISRYPPAEEISIASLADEQSSSIAPLEDKLRSSNLGRRKIKNPEVFKSIIPDGVFLLKDKDCPYQFSFDEFSNTVFVSQKEDPNHKIPLNKVIFDKVNRYLEEKTKKSWSNIKVEQCIYLLAHEASFHPVKSELESYVWDGKERIKSFISDIFELKETEEYQYISLAFFSQLIRRIYDPGCKADHMLLLSGPQGIGKSTFARTISIKDSWFLDTSIEVGHRDSMLALKGKWVVEFSELSSLKKADVEKIKSFLSSQVDKYRPPYGRVVESHPRTCVFIGTTNEDFPLKDPTGSRRFWPLKIERVNLDLLRSSISQLYAEAYMRYMRNEYYYHDPSPTLQEEAYDSDVWENLIFEYLDEHAAQDTTIEEIASIVLGIPISNLDRATQTRIGNILTRAGWKKIRVRKGSSRLRVYRLANSE
jgi:putative DNA primase/helicase